MTDEGNDEQREGKGMKQSGLMSLDRLRRAFITGAIPTEDDYAALIELADLGRQAVGLDEKMSPKALPDTGLTWTPGGALALKLADNRGVNVSGLIAGSDGLRVNPGPGIRVDGQGVAVNAIGALRADGSGLQVALGAGLTLSGNAVAVHLDPNGGLTSESGLAVKLADKSGLKLTGNALGVHVDSTYLEIDGDKGLKLNNDCLNRVVTNIGGALKTALDMVGGYQVDRTGRPDSSSDARIQKLKVAARLQKTFSDALDAARDVALGQTPSQTSPLKGWAGSMSMSLSNARSSGQGDMMIAMVNDAAERQKLIRGTFRKANDGVFLPVRLTAAIESASIDCGSCSVLLQDKSTRVARRLYVGGGGYFLDFHDVPEVEGENAFDSILSITLPGCLNGASVMFAFAPPPPS